MGQSSRRSNRFVCFRRFYCGDGWRAPSSADVTPGEDRRKIFEPGADDFVRKPFRGSDSFEVMAPAGWRAAQPSVEIGARPRWQTGQVASPARAPPARSGERLRQDDGEGVSLGFAGRRSLPVPIANDSFIATG